MFLMNSNFRVRSENHSPTKNIVDNFVIIQCFGETADCCTEEEVDFAVKILKANLDKIGREAKTILRKNRAVPKLG